MLFFVALFVEYFWVRKFLLIYENANVIHRWGFGDDATGGMWDVPRFRDIPLGYEKVPSSEFLDLVASWLSNLQRGVSLFFLRFCHLCYLMGLKLIPFFCLFACRMARGHEETSTSQAGCKRRTSRETPIVSSLVAAIFLEELRSFSQVLADIRPEVADGLATPTIEGADIIVYFTSEQFTAGLRFPIMSLVKQFLHFTKAPPVLVYLNVFWILMGCSVLNLPYQLDISLVEICFIYTLKLGVGAVYLCWPIAPGCYL